MKDWMFYPLAALTFAGIIIFALGLGGPDVELSESDIRANGYGLSGEELIDLTASPGTELVVSDGTAKAVAVQNQASAPAGAGVFLTLPPFVERMVMEKDVEVTWRVRRVRGEGEVRLGYFTVGAGDSGWRDFALTEDWQDIRLSFRPNAGEENFDYAGLWPNGGEADGVPVEIESVRVRITGG